MKKGNFLNLFWSYACS